MKPTCKTGNYGKAKFLNLWNSWLKRPIHHGENITSDIFRWCFLQEQLHFLKASTCPEVLGQNLNSAPAWISARSGLAPSTSSQASDWEEHVAHSPLCLPEDNWTMFNMDKDEHGLVRVQSHSLLVRCKVQTEEQRGPYLDWQIPVTGCWEEWFGQCYISLTNLNLCQAGQDPVQGNSWGESGKNCGQALCRRVLLWWKTYHIHQGR